MISMKITIEGTPNELNELLQAIGSSEEQEREIIIDPVAFGSHLDATIRDIHASNSK